MRGTLAQADGAKSQGTLTVQRATADQLIRLDPFTGLPLPFYCRALQRQTAVLIQ